jgi:hypothetical protein
VQLKEEKNEVRKDKRREGRERKNEGRNGERKGMFWENETKLSLFTDDMTY